VISDALPAETARPVVIQPSRGLLRINVGELWAYRELLAILVWRDIKVRYKQTAIGVAWAVLQPVTTMIVFTLVFGKFANFPSQGLPYPVFVFSGLLPWLYFASSLSASSMSVVSNVNLVTKVYFPRVLLPLAAVSVPAVDLLVSSVVLAALMLWFGIAIGPLAPLILVFLVLALATAFGTGLFFSALNVRFRDVPYIIPFLVQIWLYLSPVIYPVSALPERWQWVLSLNPMTAVIDGFRWALLERPAPDPAKVAVSALVAVLMVLAGYAFFRRAERQFADKI